MVRPDVEKQFEILYLKHTWIMTIIYTMTFGSFIGFANAFPGLIKVTFKTVNADIYQFLGPLLGA